MRQKALEKVIRFLLIRSIDYIADRNYNITVERYIVRNNGGHLYVDGLLNKKGCFSV